MIISRSIQSDVNCSGALRAPNGGQRPPLQPNAQSLMSLCIEVVGVNSPQKPIASLAKKQTYELPVR